MYEWKITNGHGDELARVSAASKADAFRRTVRLPLVMSLREHGDVIRMRRVEDWEAGRPVQV